MISSNSLEQIFELKSYDEVLKGVKIFNRNTINYYFYVKIPNEICRYVELVNIEDITSSAVSLDYTRSVKRDCKKPWISIESNLLDLSNGMHLYSFQFVDTRTDNSFNLYMSYIIHDADVEKPYIYMNKEGGCASTYDTCNSFE